MFTDAFPIHGKKKAAKSPPVQGADLHSIDIVIMIEMVPLGDPSDYSRPISNSRGGRRLRIQRKHN